MHRCPRCKHNPNNPGNPVTSCTLPIVVSQNGVVASVRVNPNGLGGADSEGYLGIELVVAPSNPGSYFLKFEVLEGKQYLVRQHADIITDYSTPAGQYQGAFRFITMVNAEFLDSNFRRLQNNLISATAPAVSYFRYKGPADTSTLQASLTATRPDDSVVQGDVSLTITKLGNSQEYIGSFYAVPEGWSGTVPSDRPSVRIAVGEGSLAASHEDGGGQASSLRARSTTAVAMPAGSLFAGFADSRSPIGTEVAEVGFASDHKISKWPNAGDVFDPNDNQPIWTSASGGGRDDPVAYTLGVKPKLFGRAVLPLLLATSVDVRALFQGQEVGRKLSVPVSSYVAVFQDLDFVQDIANRVHAQRAQLTWEVRDRWPKKLGAWSTLNDSVHTIYWTYGDPMPNPFANRQGNSFAPLYDLALRHALEPLVPPPTETDPAAKVREIRRRIAEEVERNVTYNANQQLGNVHPLELIGFSGQCIDNSMLLRGLFRSIGLDGEALYVWNGTTSVVDNYLFRGDWANFQISAPQRDNEPVNPHFEFHAVVRALPADGYFYDPSYGTSPTVLDFLESLEPKQGGGWQFTTSETRQRLGTGLPPPNPTTEACPH